MDTPSHNAGSGRDPDRDPDGDRRRIDELDERLRKARGPVKAEPKLDLRVSHRQTGVAYRVMVDMIAGLLVGGFFGYWLDRWQGWAPYSLVVGLILGFAAGVNNAWRAIRNYSDEAAKGDGNRLP
jgi:ATP synthase protein I